MTSGPPRSLRPASKRVLQVGQRVSVFFLQASAPHCAAYAGQFRACGRTAPGPALGPHYLHFRVKPAENLAGPPAVFRNTLCPAPAGPALLPPAGAAWPGRPA